MHAKTDSAPPGTFQDRSVSSCLFISSFNVTQRLKKWIKDWIWGTKVISLHFKHFAWKYSGMKNVLYILYKQVKHSSHDSRWFPGWNGAKKPRADPPAFDSEAGRWRPDRRLLPCSVYRCTAFNSMLMLASPQDTTRAPDVFLQSFPDV